MLVLHSLAELYSLRHAYGIRYTSLLKIILMAISSFPFDHLGNFSQVMV